MKSIEDRLKPLCDFFSECGIDFLLVDDSVGFGETVSHPANKIMLRHYLVCWIY